MDRWAELVFCVLNVFAKHDAARSRLAVAALRDLEIIEPNKLAEATDTENETFTVVRHVLARYGFDEPALSTAIRVLSHIASVVSSSNGGKVQRYLRAGGESMRDALAAEFGSDALADSKLKEAIAHWLQNVTALPLAVYDDETVAEFCHERGIGREELEAIADDLDLHIALVEDLIRLDRLRLGVGP